MQATPWLIRRGTSRPRLRLYCFTYAGGSATVYLPWHRALPEGVELCAVQLPGHGMRLREPLLSDVPTLMRQLLEVFSQETRLPFVFFGHSLGSLLAFELARLARLHHMAQPLHLIASGSDAPQLRRPPKKLNALDDTPLLDALTAYDGTPKELLENAELMALALPVSRADFALAANYTYRPAPTLTMPITVFQGRDDHELDLKHVHDWSRETTAECDLQWFEGRDFFINSAHTEVMASLNTVLSRYL